MQQDGWQPEQAKNHPTCQAGSAAVAFPPGSAGPPKSTRPRSVAPIHPPPGMVLLIGNITSIHTVLKSGRLESSVLKIKSTIPHQGDSKKDWEIKNDPEPW